MTRVVNCGYRFTTYRDSDFAVQDRHFGLQLHHPQFLEWVGAPKSARLLGWTLVNGSAVHVPVANHYAARQLANVLDQYALCLQGGGVEVIGIGGGAS